MKNTLFEVSEPKIFFVQVFFFIVIVTSVCLSAMSVSCKLTPEGISILTGDYVCPKLEEFKTVSSSELKMIFSKPIKIYNLSVCDFQTETEILKTEQIQTVSNNEVEFSITLDEQTECGKKYFLRGIAEDFKGNTLSFSLAFSGYNENIPELYLNELRVKYSKAKAEYVEIVAESDGNLAGVRLEFAKKDLFYEFPCCEVKKGDYIVVHLRNSDTVAVCSHDFWLDNETTSVAATDVVLLRERKNGSLLDAVLIAESDKTEWGTDTKRKEFAQEAFESGLWPDSSEIENAVCSDGVTVTRTISRINWEQGKDSWIVTNTSGATPGEKNCTEPYVKK